MLMLLLPPQPTRTHGVMNGLPHLAPLDPGPADTTQPLDRNAAAG